MQNDIAAHLSAKNLEALPGAGDERTCVIATETWLQLASSATGLATGEIAATIDDKSSRRWLEAIFGNSPYLTRVALRDPQIVIDVLKRGPDTALRNIFAALDADDPAETRPHLMARLRKAKRHVSLIVAMADLAALWPLDRVTGALSDLAETTLQAALRHVLRAAERRGELTLGASEQPEADSGVIILGMGKLGARELNYSSDIDLIVLFDPDKIHPTGRETLQGTMNRLTRDLVAIMEERTADGYVFRTDLRLRPDPSSTPPAVSLPAAEIYYASLGQNWERMAMIKARTVAGDKVAGQAFLNEMRPFIWRRYLDFAAVRDIQSIKRQIEARHGQPIAEVAGYNVKLGHGGIREIEFFAQTLQLIWGGREPKLRCRGTLDTLEALLTERRIDHVARDKLSAAYLYLRGVEHRLQMIEDQQTHTLPTDQAALTRFATFMGEPDLPSFQNRLAAHLTSVRLHFGELFGEAPPLSAAGGNLVFTGNEDDPETQETLRALGFKHPETVSAAIREWHHGKLRATRGERARELLTELAPQILKDFGQTANPDFAFAHFDRFLGGLPAGVQLLSLFRSNPQLLHLVAEIMGEAPGLGALLSRRPALLDSVLAGDFFADLPVPDQALPILQTDLAMRLARAQGFEEQLDITRSWTAEQRFRVGTHLLLGRVNSDWAGFVLSAVAQTVIMAMLRCVEDYLATVHGRIPGGRFVVLGMGKLGSREMTISSDLDLVFLYDAPPETEGSDGAKPLALSTYYTRLGQRLINALTVPTTEGVPYRVDMRLRPSGSAGPLAVSLTAFRRYHEESAWTWEHMALSRARVVAGDLSLAQQAESLVLETLGRPRNGDELVKDVANMRARIAEAHPAPKPWDIKYRRGGLIDVEFIAQYLQLKYAANVPVILVVNMAETFRMAGATGLIEPALADTLRQALSCWHQMQGILRLCLDKEQVEDPASDLLDRILARATGIQEKTERDAFIERVAHSVSEAYQLLIERPAASVIAGAAGLSSDLARASGPA